MLTMTRTMEIALKQAECMEKHGQNHSGSNEESIDKIRSSKSLQKQPLKHFPRQQPVLNGPVNRPRTATNQGNQKCRNCGGAYPHQSKCSAFGMECDYCHKRNHFLSMCRKRIKSTRRHQELHEISENDNEDEQISDTEVSFELSPHINQVSNKVPRLNFFWRKNVHSTG